MDEGDSKLILELIKENNKILHSMQRSARFGSFLRVLYWSLIIGSMIGSYYFIQPYIDQLLRVYKDINSTVGDVKNKVGGIPDLSNIKLSPEVLDKLDALLKNK